jgi:hypothetical protein
MVVNGLLVTKIILYTFLAKGQTYDNWSKISLCSISLIIKTLNFDPMLAELINWGPRLDRRALIFSLPAFIAGAFTLTSLIYGTGSGTSASELYLVTPVALLTWIGATTVSIMFFKLGEGKHEAGGLAGQPEPGDEPVPHPQSEPAPENPEAIPEGGVPEPLPLGSLSGKGIFRLFKSKGTSSVGANDEYLDQKTEEILASLRQAIIKNLKAGFVVSSIEVHMKPLAPNEVNTKQESGEDYQTTPKLVGDTTEEKNKTGENDPLLITAASR